MRLRSTKPTGDSTTLACFLGIFFSFINTPIK
jgi:hypothetical protein